MLIAGAAACVAAWAVTLGSIAARQSWPDVGEVDAVLVLGTSSTLRGTPNPCMSVRVSAGVALVERGLADTLIVSGGLDPRDGFVEAETMRDLAVEAGLDPSQIVVEDRATSTIENLVFAIETLDAPDPRLIVVTEPFHMPRAMFAARRLGISAQAAPSPRCPDRDPTWVAREPAATVWYLWKLRPAAV
jgi:uncharacterized SAM-binding protein YcdF (DUF218 family)